MIPAFRENLSAYLRRQPLSGRSTYQDNVWEKEKDKWTAKVLPPTRLVLWEPVDRGKHLPVATRWRGIDTAFCHSDLTSQSHFGLGGRRRRLCFHVRLLNVLLSRPLECCWLDTVDRGFGDGAASPKDATGEEGVVKGEEEKEDGKALWEARSALCAGSRPIL